MEELLSPAPCGGGKDGDGSKELLRHLLKDKTAHVITYPTGHAPSAACRHSSNDSIHSEEEDRPCSHGNVRQGRVNCMACYAVALLQTELCVCVMLGERSRPAGLEEQAAALQEAHSP